MTSHALLNWTIYLRMLPSARQVLYLLTVGSRGQGLISFPAARVHETYLP
jgi:hypothetical protein